jgi:ABC-2 type transport system ATP-binding protein
MKIDQKEAGFEIKSVNLRKPTLEDVFLYFTGKTIRDGEASQEEKNKMTMRGRFRR